MMIAGLAQFCIGRTHATSSGNFKARVCQHYVFTTYSLWRFRMGGGELHAQCMISDSLAAARNNHLFNALARNNS
jgi:hypothetical protein